MSSRKWIVSGGGGFIGSNLVRRLAADGFELVVLDNLTRPSAPLNLAWLRTEVPDALTFHHVDVRDADAVDAVVAEHADAEAVVHLAAQVAVTTSLADPRADFEVNAAGTLNVLEAVRAHAAEAAVLYASTNKVYGALESHRVDEEAVRYVDADFPNGIPESHPLDPRAPYGCSKAAGDLYALDYATSFGLRAVSLRQSCIYGPRQFGVEDQGWVAWFAIATLLGRPLTVYGTGKQVRDLLHVDDLVDLYVRVVDRIDACVGRALNVGGGPANSLSLLELLAVLGERRGAPVEFASAPARTADQKVFVCDVSRARELAAWEPQVPVRQGVDELLSWVERHAEAAEALLVPA